MTENPTTKESKTSLAIEPQVAVGPLEHSLSEEIKELLSARQDGKITVGSLFDAMGDKGFGLAMIMVALPSAIPVPAAGYSTPFGIILMMLAGQMILRRPRPWLPQWARKITLNDKLASAMLSGVAKFFGHIEHLIHPRWSWLSGAGGQIFAGVVIFLMAFLMFLPIPGTNTFPAIVIFLTGVAVTENDGLLMAGTTLLGAATAAVYAVLLGFLFYFGATGVGETIDLIRQQLGF